ncbi:MAG: prepilin peptidase [Candidatus Eremiobacteraeota bacterium]|nr:prepilin peptidase [Candidatus Eremiobacteraeota bacterium]
MTPIAPGAGVLLVGITAAAAVSDLRTRRIPNLLPLALVIGALALHAFDGFPALAADVCVGVVAFVAGTLAFARGWLGGGDVKLIAAAAVAAGAGGALSLVLDVLIAGGVLAVADAVRRGRVRALVASTIVSSMGGVPTEGTRLPYGVAIAAGACTYVLAPFLRFPG